MIRRKKWKRTWLLLLYTLRCHLNTFFLREAHAWEILTCSQTPSNPHKNIHIKRTDNEQIIMFTLVATLLFCFLRLTIILFSHSRTMYLGTVTLFSHTQLYYKNLLCIASHRYMQLPHVSLLLYIPAHSPCLVLSLLTDCCCESDSYYLLPSLSRRLTVTVPLTPTPTPIPFNHSYQYPNISITLP